MDGYIIIKFFMSVDEIIQKKEKNNRIFLQIYRWFTTGETIITMSCNFRRRFRLITKTIFLINLSLRNLSEL